MPKEEAPNKLPVFVQSVVEELHFGYWKPQSLAEWTEVHKTTTLLNVWVTQQEQERGLRKMVGIWVFVLISLQILGVFALVVLDGAHVLALNEGMVKFLIPSVLSEVFGMGFVVVKYLFRVGSFSPFGLGSSKE